MPVHCTWCGEALFGAGRFCAACGSPVETNKRLSTIQPKTVDRPQRALTEQVNENDGGSLSRLARLRSALSLLIIVPVALAVMIVSTALPILLVVALLRGPTDTWQMLGDWVPSFGDAATSEDCEGFPEWLSDRNERGDRAYQLLQTVANGEVADPDSIRIMARDLQSMTSQQLLSEPPQEAETLNGMLADLYSLYAMALLATANDNYAAYQTIESEFELLVTQLEAEDQRLREFCL